MNNLTINDILAEDGGQSFLESIYPELHPCFRNKSVKVKLRPDDKTASAGVFPHKDTKVFMLKDFGGGADNKAQSPVQVSMDFHRCDAPTAIGIIAKFYGKTITYTAPRAGYNSRIPTPDEQAGTITITAYKEFTVFEALTILTKSAWKDIEWNGVRAKQTDTDVERLEMARQLFGYYRLKSIASYEQVNKEGTLVHIYTSNDNFPIFAFDEGEFQKIYKPLDDKKYRFLYAGKKPENYVHGLFQHQNLIKANETINDKLKNDALEKGVDIKKGTLLPERFNEVVICSGGSDALNVAACGFRVIWLNSETAKIDNKTYNTFCNLAREVYNLPDIDSTGRTSANKLADRYIDLKTVWLPNSLLSQRDRLGNACKDVRDYLKFYTAYNLKTLIENALPFKFWDEQTKTDKEGNAIFKFGREVTLYQFNHVCGYNFLQMNGFFRYPDAKEKSGYYFIHIKNNIVSRVEANIVKNFIHDFLKKRTMPQELRNTMYRSQQLSEQSLSNLEEFEPNFKHYDIDFQYLFFDKTVWKITESGIEKVAMPDVYVWEHKVLKMPANADVSILPSMFSISEIDRNWWIQYDEKNIPDFFKFLIQTCKIHWRTELEERMDFNNLKEKEQAEYIETRNLDESLVEKMRALNTAELQKEYTEKNRFRLDGDLLTAEEIAEQQLCLVNRIFVIGYLLHRYKDPAKPWAAFIMDYRVSDEGASNGRAGKGLLAKALYKMLSYFQTDGRKKDMFDYEHVWQEVEKDTELIHIEDWHEFQEFPRLFTPLTSSLTSNPKGKRSTTYPFQDYGKFFIDTNFADRYMDGSSRGRKLYSVFGDFYHEDTEFYKEVRTPQTELGSRLFDDWDEKEYNQFYNFMGQCLQFYLSKSKTATKIDPPFANIQRRNSLSIMGENFRQWADTYYDSRMNIVVERKTAHEDCMKAANMAKLSPQAFFKKVQAWCEFNAYAFNPEHVQGWQRAGDNKKFGYIKRSVPAENGKYTTIEYLYIGAENHKQATKVIVDDTQNAF